MVTFLLLYRRFWFLEYLNPSPALQWGAWVSSTYDPCSPMDVRARAFDMSVRSLSLEVLSCPPLAWDNGCPSSSVCLNVWSLPLTRVVMFTLSSPRDLFFPDESVRWDMWLSSVLASWPMFASQSGSLWIAPLLLEFDKQSIWSGKIISSPVFSQCWIIIYLSSQPSIWVWKIRILIALGLYILLN